MGRTVCIGQPVGAAIGRPHNAEDSLKAGEQMYQALYRKYRPQTFDDVVGQTGVTQTLKNQILAGKLSHAYLFTGTRGTGKTSCAKILAKAVNCLSPADGSPCNCCAACKSIDNGSCMDVLEIDAASNNGVDNVRTLREDAVYAPAEVKMRVYIIDEVHMLSQAAFNALLKIIEEPPPHLLFILATTELHKVPVTILSRCQRFSFRRLTPEDIADRLRWVCYMERLDAEPEAIALLSRLADGALRDGLSLLDQCAASGAITEDAVCAILGLAGERKCAELLQAVASHDTKAALSLLAQQYAAGKDLSAMLGELSTLCRDLLVLRTAPKSGRAMLTGACTDEELDRLLPLFTPAELLRLTGLLLETSAGLRGSANRRIDTELCLIRMCEPGLSLEPEALNARLSRLEEALSGGSFVPAAPAPKAEEPQPPKPEPEPPQAEEPPVDEEQPAPPAPSGNELPDGFWAELAAKAGAGLPPSMRGMFTVGERQMVNPVLKGEVLYLVADSAFIKGNIDRPEIRSVFRERASALLHRQVDVRIVTKAEMEGNNDRMEELLRFARAHSDIVTVTGQE